MRLQMGKSQFGWGNGAKGREAGYDRCDDRAKTFGWLGGEAWPHSRLIG